MTGADAHRIALIGLHLCGCHAIQDRLNTPPLERYASRLAVESGAPVQVDALVHFAAGLGMIETVAKPRCGDGAAAPTWRLRRTDLRATGHSGSRSPVLYDVAGLLVAP